MNKKEKEAIELLDLFEPDDLVECAMYRNALSIIKNLIDKQQKEIDKQNKVIDAKEQEIEYLNCIIESDKDNYINKDRIKEKIEKIENMYNKLPKNPKEHLHSRTEYKIVIGELQSLLEKELENEQ